MKLLYPQPKFTPAISSIVKIIFAVLYLIAAGYSVANAQASQELVFKNAVLKSGNEGQDGAVYRFPSVMSGVDALVKINARSSSMVSLVTIDLTNTGFEKAFQPQVTYGNNTSPNGNKDWWMEFQIDFVKSNTTTPQAMDTFNVTSLDIDGNNDKISEYQSFYGQKSFTLEALSALVSSAIQEKVNDVWVNVGRRFDGPVMNFTDVDTLSTAAMVTNMYSNTNSLRVRTGAKSTGVSGAADRMYSMWFKTFTYNAAITKMLPVTLINWSAAFANNSIALKWATSTEKNASHFIVERSFDGIEYTDAAMLFAAGNSNLVTNYSFNDKLPAGSSGTVYYRLKMADMDGNYKLSDVRIVRTGKSAETVKVLAYPNPVVNEVRITVPQNWQGKQLSYQLANTNGQIIKSYTVQYASQTEVINMTQSPAGMYVLRVINGNETAVQSVIKSNK